MSPRSMYELLRDVADSSAERIAYRYKRDERWHELTWGQFRTSVDRLARALMACGLVRGDRVAILARTRLEWMEADAAIVSAGGVTVGIYPASIDRDCCFILEHSEARILVVEDSAQLDKILPALARLAKLETIVVIDGAASGQRTLAWQSLLARADEVSAERLQEVGRSLGERDLAAMVYTSGTTGTPKGVMISHGNLLFTTWSAAQCLPVKPGYETLVFLPLAHVFARMIVWLCLRERVVVAFAQDLASVPEDLREIRPHFITSVPRIFEKVRERVLARAEQAGGLKSKLFTWSLGVGAAVSARRQAGQALSPLLRFEHWVADRLALHKVREAFGGRLLFAVSGAAPLSRTVAEFFHSCGVLILEGIGMTENTSFSNVNRIERNKFGTVGTVGPGIEMRLGADGEVLIRGANVMVGYLKDAAATAEAVDADGWLHTGDVGTIDEEGYLTITDRKKDLIITAGGKNIAPQRLEKALEASKYIGQAVAYGDKRKYVTALVTLATDGIAEWARVHGRDATPEALARDPAVHELVEAEIAAVNGELASYESIKKFRILPRELAIETGELTPTLKVKRKVVYQKYAQLLDEMYD